MKKGKRLTRIELLCSIFFITILIAPLIVIFELPSKIPTSPTNRVHKIKTRVVCGNNLKSLGIAMTAYANDYRDRFPQLPGTGPWSKELGFDYFLEKPDFKAHGAQANTPRTISASWYLLIKYADVSPKTFICPAQKTITVFDGSNPKKRDITKLWDFGSNPYKHVSYAMHNPYGKYPADDQRSAAFAVAADMSPYFNNGDIIQASTESLYKTYPKEPFSQQLYNSLTHNTESDEVRRSTDSSINQKRSEGQLVLYADGHSSFETRPDVGVRNDNIYTYWLTKTNSEPNEPDKRGGQPPTGRGPENDAQDKDDSFLAI